MRAFQNFNIQDDMQKAKIGGFSTLSTLGMTNRVMWLVIHAQTCYDFFFFFFFLFSFFFLILNLSISHLFYYKFGLLKIKYNEYLASASSILIVYLLKIKLKN